MQKLTTLLLGVFLYTSIQAQTVQNYRIQSLSKDNSWIKIHDADTKDPSEVIEIVKEFYSLGDEEGFDLYRTEVDDLGITHYRYYQTHNGVRVYNASLLMHFKKDGVITIKANFIKGITASGQYSLSEAEALEKAKEFIGAEEYYWEIPEMEALIKRIQKDENASYFPQGKLILTGRNGNIKSDAYVVNWKFEINAKGDKMRTFVYVNAMNGDITFTTDGIHTNSSNGVGHTRYHGVQDIITDSTGADNDDFILYDNTRGGGLSTLNCQESTNTENAVEFTDADNIWDNANDDKDDAAVDAHWGMEMTYDYFFEKFGINGWNNLGWELISYVHYDENYFNAFWNGSVLTFGDGSGNPLTSIDVVGHEFAHGVTQNFAELDYVAESGGLNESFSDIFGTAIEFWALEDSLSSWVVGEANFQFRDMSNPNEYQQPDTYEGDYWFDFSDYDFPPYDAPDNGGVHTNSGVQNYWFYLLCEGGSGVNDNGYAYQVEGLGMDTAAAIAFRNLVYELSDLDTYEDAYIGSIESVTDLYGACSEEMRQVLKAWWAVGIGVPELSKDLAINNVVIPQSSCYLTESESASLLMIYNYIGCEEELPSGTSFTLSYSIDETDSISVDVTLTDALQSGDTLLYTLENMDLSEYGRHYIDFWVELDDDLILFNNVAHNQEVTHQVQLASEDVVGFESLTFSPDSFYVEVGEYADYNLSTLADNSGSRGFRMTAADDNPDPDLIVLPYEEEDNFTANPEFNSKICFCVDASDWENVRLAFDMKQYFDAHWEEIYGEDMSEFVSSMRILVNGEQIGEQYHPTTEKDDPYLSYYVNLDDYAGTNFEACFESVNFIPKSDNHVPGSKGDKTDLDNVRFADDAALSVNEESNAVFLVYPNPSNSTFFIDVRDIQNEYTISVVDALGKVVYEKESNDSNTTVEVSLDTYVKGIYIVRIQTKTELLSKRLILQ